MYTRIRLLGWVVVSTNSSSRLSDWLIWSLYLDPILVLLAPRGTIGVVSPRRLVAKARRHQIGKVILCQKVQKKPGHETVDSTNV